jgi:hypothetical protein
MASFLGGVYTGGMTDPTIGAIDPMHDFKRNELDSLIYTPDEYAYQEQVFVENLVVEPVVKAVVNEGPYSGETDSWAGYTSPAEYFPRDVTPIELAVANQTQGWTIPTVTPEIPDFGGMYSDGLPVVGGAPLDLGFNVEPAAATVTAATAENLVHPNKGNLWDRITPGSSTSPGEMMDDVSDVIDVNIQMPEIKIDLPNPLGGLSNLMPLLLIGMLIKD